MLIKGEERADDGPILFDRDLHPVVQPLVHLVVFGHRLHGRVSSELPE